MKNISERENREQFKGFYNMIYQLKADELAPFNSYSSIKNIPLRTDDLKLAIYSRHMKPNEASRPDDRENPPLIPYYFGN